MIAGAFGGISLIGMGYAVKRTIENVEAMSNFADSVGITVEALSGLEVQARGTGMETEDLYNNLNRFAKAMGEGKVKGEGLADGLSKFAEYIRSLPTGVERVTAAMDVFGRGGARMVPMLMQGAQGMKDSVAEAKKLGLALSDVDVQQILEADRALDHLREMFRGIAVTFVKEVSPYISVAVDMFREWATSGEGAVGKIRDAFAGVLDNIKSVREVLLDIVTVFYQIEVAYLKFMKNRVGAPGNASKLDLAMAGAGMVGSGVISPFYSLVGATPPQDRPGYVSPIQRTLDEAATNAAEITKKLASYDEAIATAEDRLAKVATWREGRGATGSFVVDTLNEFVRRMADIPAKVAEIAKGKWLGMGGGGTLEEQERIDERLKELDQFVKRIRDDLKTPVWKFADEIGDVREALKLGKITAGEAAEAIDHFGKELEAAELKKLGKIPELGEMISGAALRGSTEAATAMARWQMLPVREKEAQKHTQRLTEIRDYVRDMKAMVFRAVQQPGIELSKN